MANKRTGTKRGRKGSKQEESRKEEENRNGSQAPSEDSDSSHENASQHKMESSNAANKAKGGAKKGSKGKRGAKRPKLESESEPVAGPSGLCGSKHDTVIETFDSMIACKYKSDMSVPSTSKGPYEIKWGTEFLNTLTPKVEQEKSILKSPSDEKKVKQRTRFTQTTVYYFERAQPHSKIPKGGDMAVGMEQTHFYTNLVPIEVYEAQKQQRFKRELAAVSYRPQNRRTVEAQMQRGGGDQKVVLHTIQVPAELLEEEDIRSGCVKNAPKGCSCNDYCDPDICECNLTGKSCEVIKEGFPCGCKLEYCKNSNGRKEFNSRYVRSNLISLTNLVSNNSGNPVNEREQIAPAQYHENE